MKCRIPFKASVAGGKVAGLGVMEAHLRQETSWPNQALQPTCNLPLRSRLHAAELGRWALKSDLASYTALPYHRAHVYAHRVPDLFQALA